MRLQKNGDFIGSPFAGTRHCTCNRTCPCPLIPAYFVSCFSQDTFRTPTLMRYRVGSPTFCSSRARRCS